MPRRTVQLLAATVLAVAALGTSAARAQAAPAAGRAALVAAGSPGGQAFSMSTSTLAVMDGPTGAHAVTLAYNLWLPASASATRPAPVLIATNGFGLDKDAAELVSLGQFFASHGYVFLAWTAQGFGTSGGCVQNDSVDYESRDASAFLDLLTARPDTLKDGKGIVAGMVGGSLGGGLDATTAEVEPRVRAIVPGRTWNALQYALAPNNLVDPADPTGFDHLRSTATVFKQQWTTLFFAVGNAGPAQGKGGCEQEKLAAGDASGATCPGYPLAICTTYADVTANPNASQSSLDTLRRSSSGAFIDRLTVPTLLQQGQSDTLFNLNEAMATYSSLQRRGIPVGFLWNDGGHGGYNSRPGEGEEFDGVARTPAEMDHDTIPLAQLGWFDHYLLGLDVPVVGFSWFRDYAANTATPTGASAYTSAPALPVMPATTYRLSGTDALTTGAAAAGSPSFLVPAGGQPAAYSETANFTGPDSSPSLQGVPPTEQPGQNVAFTSPPFAVDTESVGFPAAHLHLSHLNPLTDAVFFGKVYDVAPDGSAQLIRRLVAPVRVADGALGAAVDMKLLGFAHVFAAGHRVRLLLASTDASYKVPGIADQLSVVTGGPDPSTFTVPQRPLVAAPAPAATAPSTAAAGASARPTHHATPARRPVARRTTKTAVAAPTVPTRTLAFTGLGLGVPAAGAALLVGGLLARRRRRSP